MPDRPAATVATPVAQPAAPPVAEPAAPPVAEPPAPPVAELDALARPEARALLTACCASPAWVAAMLAGRPYGDPARVLAASDEVFARLSDADVERALDAHPRIGERASGTTREAGWSRQEQQAVGAADDGVRAALAEGNRAYEERFDRVFLIRAAGRSPEEMLAELTRRLAQPEADERAEVREQLRQITRLRLAGPDALGDLGGPR